MKFKVGDVVKSPIARGGIIKGVDLNKFGYPKYYVYWPNGYTGYFTDSNLELDLTHPNNKPDKFKEGDFVSATYNQSFDRIGGTIRQVRKTYHSSSSIRRIYIVDWPNGDTTHHDSEDSLILEKQFKIGDKVMADPIRPFLKGYKAYFGIIQSEVTSNSGRYLVSWFSIDDKKFIRDDMINGNLLVPFREEVEVDDKVILKNGDVGVILETSSEKTKLKEEPIRTFLVLHSGKKNVLLREDFYLFEQ